MSFYTIIKNRLWRFGHGEHKDDEKAQALMETENPAEGTSKEDLVGLCHMESSGLSREDARDRDHWRLKVKGKPPNSGLSEKRPLKWQVCVLLYNCYFKCFI